MHRLPSGSHQWQGLVNGRIVTELRRWLFEPGLGGDAVAINRIGPHPAFDEVEAACVARAVAKRVNEFRTGRELARQALRDLGQPPVRIPIGPARDPIWPAGFLGSISHSDTLCIAHVGRRSYYAGIGLDIESDDPLEPELVPFLAGLEEWKALRHTSIGGLDPGKLCFSAKEAFYKAYFPACRMFLDFTDVYLTVDWDQASFQVALINSEKLSFHNRRHFQGRFAHVEKHVITSVLIAS